MPPADGALSVLVLTPDFPPAPGGIQLLVHRLVANLEGTETTVVALGTEGAPEFDAHSGLNVKRVARKGERNRSAVAMLNLGGLVTGLRNRPDAVISAHPVTSPAATVLRRLTGAPVVQYVHGDEFRTRPGLSARAVSRADRAIAVSRYTREMAIAAGCDPANLHVVNPGVDLPERVERRPSERPTILTVARLREPYKGHDQMIRALPLVRERVPDVEWVVIGDGPLRPHLERMAAEHGVEESIRFLGRASDSERDRRLSSAHVFAMPSRLPDGGVGGEGFGIVYLEAGAHRLPVVGGAGGALDAVVDGETGRLVDPTDHRDIAAALAELLGDREQAERMGRAGAERARQLSWRRHADTAGGLIRDAVEERG